MKRTLGSAIGLVGAVALVVTLGRTMTRTAGANAQDVGSGGQPPDDSRQKIAMLQAQVAFLQGRLTATEARCAAPMVAAASAKPAISQDDSHKAPPRASPPTGGGHPDDSFVALEARALAEPADPTWAGPTERALWASAAALQPVGSLDRVHCGQELCRLDIHHGRDPSARARVTRWAEGLDDFSSERVLQTDAAGEKTTLWLARAGRSMPMAGGGGEGPATVDEDHNPNPFGKSAE